MAKTTSTVRPTTLDVLIKEPILRQNFPRTFNFKPRRMNRFRQKLTPTITTVRSLVTDVTKNTKDNVIKQTIDENKISLLSKTVRKDPIVASVQRKDIDVTNKLQQLYVTKPKSQILPAFTEQTSIDEQSNQIQTAFRTTNIESNSPAGSFQHHQQIFNTNNQFSFFKPTDKLTQFEQRTVLNKPRKSETFQQSFPREQVRTQTVQTQPQLVQQQVLNTPIKSPTRKRVQQSIPRQPVRAQTVQNNPQLFQQPPVPEVRKSKPRLSTPKSLPVETQNPVVTFPKFTLPSFFDIPFAHPLVNGLSNLNINTGSYSIFIGK